MTASNPPRPPIGVAYSPGLRRQTVTRRARPSQLAGLIVAQRENLLLLLPFTLLYLLAGWAAVFVFDVRIPEAALTQVGIWMTFWSAKPVFAAAIVLFEPLQAFLMFPWNVIEPIRTAGVSANIISAVSGAITLLALNDLLRFFGFGRWSRWPTILAFGLNPLFIYTAAAGDSLALSIAVAMITIAVFARWLERESLPYLIFAAFMASFLVLTRHEAILLVALIIGGIWFHASAARQRSSGRTTALLITFGVPVIFALTLWVAVAWFAISDPFYMFQLPTALPYIASAMGVDVSLRSLASNVNELGPAVFGDLLVLAPVAVIGLIALGASLVRGASRRRIVAFGITGLFLAFLVLALVTDNPQPMTRSWGLLLPLGMWCLLEAVGRPAGRARRAAQIAVPLVTLGLSAAVLAGLVFAPPRLVPGFEDVARVTRLETANPRLDPLRDIAREIPGLTEGPIVTDIAATFPLILLSGRPDLFLHNEAPIMPPPRATRLNPVVPQALLLRDPLVARDSDAFSRRYPTLYQFGDTYTRLLADWNAQGWRLYSIASR